MNDWTPVLVRRQDYKGWLWPTFEGYRVFGRAVYVYGDVNKMVGFRIE